MHVIVPKIEALDNTSGATQVYAPLAIHPTPTHDGIVIKVMPWWERSAEDLPELPNPTEVSSGGESSNEKAGIEQTAEAAERRGPRHVPVDIVLVIDVSGSMGSLAPVPTVAGEVQEANGLTLLDLVKHACRTILATLDTGDRLALVTFSDDATVVQPLLQMTANNKVQADTNIEEMRPRGATNLWAGLLRGLEVFVGADHKAKTNLHTGRAAAVMLLTDGMPNFMSPEPGYIPKLRQRIGNPVPIHTFGFGYNLRAGLLQSLSEYTSGNYSFIPDAGMIGTVFVHALANMQTTYATEAVLYVHGSSGLDLTQTTGVIVNQPQPKRNYSLTGSYLELEIPLGSIHYGQSRDVYLRCQRSTWGSSGGTVHARLVYKRLTPHLHQHTAELALAKVAGPATVSSSPVGSDNTVLAPGELAFHISRSMLVEFLAGLAPIDNVQEHKPRVYDRTLGAALEALIPTLPAAAAEHAEDAACAALMTDIRGQVMMALSDYDHYQRWGKFYLPSLQGAHTRQLCNSFKDPGPLLYGAESPLFVACRDALDEAFDTLPAPKPAKPTVVVAVRGAPPAYTPINMAAYRNAMAPCFASFCRVSLADGGRVPVHRLRRGMRVWTPRGPRAVAAVLKTPVQRMAMVALGRLLITPWHPVSRDGEQWVFPCKDATGRASPPVRYTGAIYSVLLERDAAVKAHAMQIEGVWVVTLGHGLTEAEEAVDGADVRVHSFFGDYEEVCRSLAKLDVRKDGLVVNGGSVRSNWRQWHTRK